MQSTPQANRKHVAIFGETNAGKSALFNAILGQDAAIVSEISGTTTDPIKKSMELLPFGPIVLIDTAGLNDKTQLGEIRVQKTKKLLLTTDFVIYTTDIKGYDQNEYDQLKQILRKQKVPHIHVTTKADTVDENTLKAYKEQHPQSYCVSVNDNNSIDALKTYISDQLSKHTEEDESIIGGLLPSGSTVILVTPIDSEAPKGRLILPQVQFIRDCLDNGIRCNVTTEHFLKEALEETKKVDLVVTDSQAFKIADQMVPNDIMLTSFSILFARQKGEIKTFMEGTKAIENLKDNSKVLVSEVCTHNTSHEDIGRYKIPAMLKKYTQKDLEFVFYTGKDFPEDLKEFDLVVHCGGCMATRKQMLSRINSVTDAKIPITNYGLVISYVNGIFNRSIEILGIQNDRC